MHQPHLSQNVGSINGHLSYQDKRGTGDIRSWKISRPWLCGLFSCLLIALVLPASLHAQSPGTLDTTFTDPNFNGGVGNLTLDANGKILAMGPFTTAGSSSTTYGRLARFNTDGTLDTTFANPNLSGAGTSQCTVTVLSTGKILVAGNFNTAGSSNAAYTKLARFNSDGTLDTTFPNVNATGTIFGAVVDANGKIIIYGSFSALFGGNTAYAKIARLNSDGSVDSTFTPPTADVSFQTAAVASSGKIYIGGGFSTVASTARHFLARLNSDGSLDTTFQDPNLVLAGGGGNARCILEDANGKVLVGGNITTAGTSNLSRGCLARFNSDGTLDTTFGDPNFNINVLRIALDTNGKIIASGAFTSVGSSSLTYYSLVRINTDGTVDTAFANPNLTDATGASAGAANGLALDSSGRILVSGNFVRAGSSSATYNHMARFFNSSPTPAVTVPGGTTTLTTTTSGTAGASVNFSITGANLTGAPGNLTVTAPTNVQVSADNSTWGSTASIPYSSATLASTPVYVRLAGTGTVGTISGNVSITGGGLSAAATQAVSGSLNNPVPTLTSISPTSVTAGAGNTLLTVTGTNFINGSVINFNGSALTTAFVSATSLTATIPSASLTTAGTPPVTVTTAAPGGGTTASQTFTINAAATGVTTLGSASSAQLSSTLAFTVPAGTNRLLVVDASDDDQKTITTVTFNGQTLIKAVSAADPSTLVGSIWYLVMGSGSAVTSSISVSTPHGQVDSVASYIAAQAYSNVDQVTPVASPQTRTIFNSSNVSPAITVASAVGDLVVDTILILDLGGPGTETAGSGQTVITSQKLPGAYSTIYKSSSKTGATSVPMSWTTSGSDTILVGMDIRQAGTATPAPTVTSISPSSGSTLGGTSVTLTGTGFTGATGVTIGGTAASSLSVTNDTTITCTTPTGAAGAASVVVTTSGGSNSANTLYTYVVPAPTVASISSTTTNGSYKATTLIPITVTFSAAVTVTGTPTLALNSGGSASYSSGSGTSTLTFNYIVGVTDNATLLDCTSTSALALAGGTINATTGGTAANLTLPTPGGANSLGLNKAIVIDTTAPTILSINRLTPTGQTTASNSVTFRVTYSEAVTVPGGSNFSVVAVNGSSIVGTVTGVTGSGTTRDVTVNITSGTGEFRLRGVN